MIESLGGGGGGFHLARSRASSYTYMYDTKVVLQFLH